MISRQQIINVSNNKVIDNVVTFERARWGVSNRNYATYPTRRHTITIEDTNKMAFQTWDYEVLQLPPGVFTLDENTQAGLFTTGKNKVIIGSGQSLTRLQLTSDNQARPVLSFYECPKVVLMDLTVDGRCTERVGWNTPIDVRGCSNVIIDNVDIVGAGNTGLRLSAGGIPGSGNTQGDSVHMTTNFSVTNVNVTNTLGPSAITSKSGGMLNGVFNNVVCDGWLHQGFSLEGEQLHGQPDTANPGGRIALNDCTAINGTSPDSVQWGLAITENMRQIVAQRCHFENINGGSIARAILVSTSPSQDDTPVDRVTIIDPTFVNVGSKTIRIVEGQSSVTNLELIRCGDSSTHEFVQV